MGEADGPPRRLHWRRGETGHGKKAGDADTFEPSGGPDGRGSATRPDWRPLARLECRSPQATAGAWATACGRCAARERRTCGRAWAEARRPAADRCARQGCRTSSSAVTCRRNRPQCEAWPASRMTRNISAVSSAWTGSQSNHVRPALELRWLRFQGWSLARGALFGAHAHGVDDAPTVAGMGLEVAAQFPFDRPAFKITSTESTTCAREPAPCARSAIVPMRCALVSCHSSTVG